MLRRFLAAPRSVIAALLLTLMLAGVAPAAFAQPSRRSATLDVYHDAVTATLANAASDGHQVGDIRLVTTPTKDADGQVIGRLDSTLTTIAVDTPAEGDEIRISVLVFSFEDGADQLVVQGTALYPPAGATIATGTSVVRPVTGGSGRFAGATGQVETWHLEDGSWRHTFTLVGMRRPLPDRPFGGHEGRGHEPDASAAPAGGIVRTLLGSVDPANAPGETLSLWHYTIPAGSALTPHTHPGFQVARIVSGTLTYNVISGEVSVLRADGTTETATTGDEITLEAGDTVIENPGLEHYGANEGSRPVIIMASSLFAAGAAPAEPLPSAAP